MYGGAVQRVGRAGRGGGGRGEGRGGGWDGAGRRARLAEQPDEHRAELAAA